jgi:short-subunit dehydrogenase
MKVQGSKVLLTGANGGIGRAFVEELLGRGVDKLYCGVRSLDGSNLPNDPRVVAIELDVTDAASIAAAAVQAADVDLLINNAGTAAYSGALTAANIDAARQEMEVNYFGPLQVTRAFKNTPVFSASGAIINVVSFLGLVTLPLAGTYSASKSAALALTRTMRAELKEKGTRVIAILPVQTDTKLGATLPDPKVQPGEVASEALDALESGLDEVFPGAPSKGAATAFKADPAAVQASLSEMVRPLA